ncbi:MAG: radical SAM protein [Planctomycetota bacterium]
MPPPDFANIETTRFCNLRCRMCIQFNDGTTVSGPHMDLAEFEQIARSVFPYVKRWQPSVSGEPTMSHGFEAMLALAGRFGVKMEMFSNGTLLSPKMIERLAPNLGALSISFDGANAETFENIREGADFDRVVASIRDLVAHCRTHLPADLQPLLSLNCTLMELNVRELPQLVRFAAELGLDQISCYHVFPVTDEMRRQSLVHHRDLARACIDEAFAVAAEVGLSLHVQALDQLTAATAVDPDKKRSIPTRDGVVEGLERRSAEHGTARQWPELDARHPEFTAIQARRAAARAASGFPEPWTGEPAAGGSIWFCDFLWHKTYVSIGGDVRACCVDGSPVLGNLLQQPFEQVWTRTTAACAFVSPPRPRRRPAADACTSVKNAIQCCSRATCRAAARRGPTNCQRCQRPSIRRSVVASARVRRRS